MEDSSYISHCFKIREPKWLPKKIKSVSIYLLKPVSKGGENMSKKHSGGNLTKAAKTLSSNKSTTTQKSGAGKILKAHQDRCH